MEKLTETQQQIYRLAPYNVYFKAILLHQYFTCITAQLERMVKKGWLERKFVGGKTDPLDSFGSIVLGHWEYRKKNEM